jgi:hypothetical protein
MCNSSLRYDIMVWLMILKYFMEPDPKPVVFILGEEGPQKAGIGE